MFERFNDEARRAVVLAQEEASQSGHDYIDSSHLLLGILRQEDSTAFNILKDLKVDIAVLIDEVQDNKGNKNAKEGHIPFTPGAKKVLERALREALGLSQSYIGSEHILLGVIFENEQVREYLSKNSIDIDMIRETVIAMDSQPKEKEPAIGGQSQRNNKKNVLEEFGRDLTKMAEEGILDPVIGRDKEIQRVIQILSRRTKNNPIIIGDSGVGKTAIAEGLAQKIIKGDVPNSIKGKTIYSLDMSSVVAGSKYRGEFEEKLNKVLKEIQKRGDVILFLDEIHNVIGAGAAEGSIDAASILKPVLARGGMQTIGTTTLDEYRKHIEKDTAFERRFQPVKIEEPTTEATVEILKGLRDRYETHHDVIIPDDVLEAAVSLSKRYITDRFLPDKAIDLIDEAGSRLYIYRDMNPTTDNTMTTEHVKEVLEMWTSIPVSDMTTDEMEKFLKLENTLHKRIVGQNEAVVALSKAIRRSKAGLKDPRRPTGSFLFLGPSGVGKTELAKTLSEFLFGDQDKMIQLDMSEYMEKHTVSRLVGSPPGYVGHDEGGQLTELVRRQPYSVVLFDEIEKAHPDVFNILLQIMEEGHLTDSKGRKVDFKNTVIIMTSNVGARGIASEHTLGFTNKKEEELDYKKVQSDVMAELKKAFKPEFLNRLDEIIVFQALTRKEVYSIVDMMMDRLREQLFDRGIGITLDNNVREFLSQEGYDQKMGARPLRRAIQRFIEDPLSEQILTERWKMGDVIQLKMKGGEISFSKKQMTRQKKATVK